MSNRVFRAMVLCTTVLFALMAGFFYSFSVTVMPGLDLVSSSSAIEAMQGINRAVRNPVFFVTFMVTPILACALAVLAWFSRRRRTAVFLLLAAASYIAGVVVPTGTINVPMNDVLASVDASAAALQVWTQYSADWTLWNTLRTLPSILALLLCTAAYGAVQEIAE